MHKIISVFSISILSAAVLLSDCAAMPVQAAQVAGRAVPVNNTAKPKANSASKIQTASPAIDAIAELGELKAGVENEYYKGWEAFEVDVEHGHNPYDVEWDYGELYDTYVEKSDWSLVFDADFYMESFPALALLYHYDEELLLEHFQTVGIHEGRQGNKKFNVAAYRKNCKKNLRDAFGDHYECYYFYWMLNQASQKSVTTTGNGYPLQLGVKMTTMQANEFEKVNEYRAEAGINFLEFDPELAAIACYRAWVNINEGYGAHDWIEKNKEKAGNLVNLLNANQLGENTVHSGVNNPDYPRIHNSYYINYRYSSEHYEAMINPKYKYFGCSHTYFGNNRIPESRRRSESTYTKPMMTVEFDMFTDTLSTPIHP